MHRVLQPKDWAAPKGYANGIATRGQTVFVAGQIGWDENAKIVSDELVDQVRQALRNIVTVLAEAGAKPEHIVSLTWYLLDKRDYLAKQKEIGEAYRDTIGRNFPTMTAVQVSALIEDRAKVEIQAVAVIPE